MNQSTGMSERSEGQVLVLFALISFVLVGALALALDTGYLMAERRAAQAAADAGALAGARRMMSGDGESATIADALSYVQANDVDLTAGSGASAAVSLTGDSTNGTVTVDVTVPVTKFFIGAIYTGDWEVAARAVAEINDNGNIKTGVIALEEPGIGINGAPKVRILGGGAFSNGDIERSGQANVFYADTSIDAVGTVEEGNLWSAGEGFNENRPVLVDPLLDTPPPAPPADVIEQAAVDLCMVSPPADCVLYPGYYRDLGVIEIGSTATLMPGLYYFENTAILLRSTNSKIEGDGVMLYFAEGSSPSTTFFDPANSSAGGVHLTAPATSPYAGGLDGMTLWIDNCSEFDAQGAGEFYIKGVFYAPCSDVWMHGNPYGETISGQIIVGSLQVTGTTDFVVKYEDYVRVPRLGVSLIE